MHADAYGKRRAFPARAFRDVFLQRLVHRTRCLGGIVGRGERTHDLVAYGFDDGATVFLGDIGEQFETLCHLDSCRGIAQCFKKTRTAADVGEEDSEICCLRRHQDNIIIEPQSASVWVPVEIIFFMQFIFILDR